MNPQQHQPTNPTRPKAQKHQPNNTDSTPPFPSEGMSPDGLLTVSEVADLLRVDDTTVRRWVKHGALEAIVLPHVNARQAYRIKRTTITKLLRTSTGVVK